MEDTVLFEKYQMGRMLGHGAFGKVYFARNIHTSQSVAIKIVNKDKMIEKNMMSHIKREIKNMGRLRHPNIIRLYEVLACKRKIYLVIEYAKGGELNGMVPKGCRLSEDLSRNYFQQLISAVGYSHFRGVFHRDLNLKNILFHEDGKLKVTDFGLSAIKEQIRPNNELLSTVCGTPAFVAPEILAKTKYDGAMVDVWACGVILYVLTAGYLPFTDPNLMNMYRKIYQGKYQCPKWMSPDLTRFLSRLLDTNPKTRITIDEITRDPWFRNGGVFKGKSSDFEFPFYHDCERDDLSVKLPAELQQVVEEEASSNTWLNAFDLIAYSSGLDLSGLFNQTYIPFEDADNFVSALPVDNIISTIREAASELNLKLYTRKEDCVVDLIGPIGNFIARVEINQLINQLVIVEVKIRGGDSVSDNDIWKNKLMPKLSGLIHDFQSQDVEEIDSMHGDELTPAISTDLGSIFQKNEDIRQDVSHRFKSGRHKRRPVTGILCDRNKHLKLKGKFYRRAFRQVLIYGSACWTARKDHLKNTMCGNTLKGSAGDEDVLKKVGATDIDGKIREYHLRWLEHVRLILEGATLRKMERWNYDELRRSQGKLKMTYMEGSPNNMKKLGLVTGDKTSWKGLQRHDSSK